MINYHETAGTITYTSPAPRNQDGNSKLDLSRKESDLQELPIRAVLNEVKVSGTRGTTTARLGVFGLEELPVCIRRLRSPFRVFECSHGKRFVPCLLLSGDWSAYDTDAGSVPLSGVWSVHFQRPKEVGERHTRLGKQAHDTNDKTCTMVKREILVSTETTTTTTRHLTFPSIHRQQSTTPH